VQWQASTDSERGTGLEKLRIRAALDSTRLHTEWAIQLTGWTRKAVGKARRGSSSGGPPTDGAIHMNHLTLKASNARIAE